MNWNTVRERLMDAGWSIAGLVLVGLMLYVGLGALIGGK